MPDDPVATDAPLAQPSRAVRSPAEGDQAGASPSSAGHRSTGSPTAGFHEPADASDGVRVIETVVSPFHCLYQDALHFHTQSRLAQSEGEAAGWPACGALLYISSAEALVRQAAVELGRPELRGLLGRPQPALSRSPRPGGSLPAIVAEPGVPTRSFDPESPPWPQFAELLMLETSWVYPGPPSSRRAYYRSTRRDGGLRAARAAQGPRRAQPGAPHRDPHLSPHRPAARPLCPAAAPPRHRPGHPRRRHRGPRSPHGRHPLPRPAPSPRAGPRRLPPTHERERDQTASSCGTWGLRSGPAPLSWGSYMTP